MKVGVFLGNLAPEQGGGFTFSDDIFQSLVRLQCKHSFVVFSNLTKEQTRGVATKYIQFVSSQRGFLERARFKLIRIAVGAVAQLPIIQNWFRTTHTNWLKRAVDDLGIEVMWFVTPKYIEIDIPFIFTVWDLQHRLQPWFPEVSANGQWCGREKMYAAAIPRASAVIVGAEAGKAEIVHFYQVPPERVRSIPHPTP